MPLGGPRLGVQLDLGSARWAAWGRPLSRGGLTILTQRSLSGERGSFCSAPSACQHDPTSFPRPPGGRAPSPGSPLTWALRGPCPPYQPLGV